MSRFGAAAVVATGLGLAACGKSEEPSECKTEVAPEVCQTPSNLRGAEAVPEVWTSDPIPELDPQPLVDGRYVMTARKHHCAQGRRLPEVSSNPLRVVEVIGCVMRTTTVLPPDEESYVGVGTFDYAEDGSLEVTDACNEDEAGGGLQYQSAFGFDGTTLVMVDASEFNGPPDPGGDCILVNTLELQ